ncbi:SCO0607 family lipoprotein [Actinacidiphila paucisporea]|uniref:Lipoprotein n=1 Tax=Actinacidiphila paucisporea TaxID=310782 RepID=A0A1M7P1B4_9ACTN|nr:hypothetical protein [Actinacidiphila paucisporea]SHN10182.1 hypothetical protein SAMN05216499_120105 [Actinacidiphila paucisporea]
MKRITGGFGRVATLVLAGAAFTALTTACSLDDRESMCMPDEYPVTAVGYAGGGDACVTKGEQPPEGMIRYPAGQVPQHVDDKWDRYWQTHALDKNGKLITDPNKVRKS